MKKIGSETNHPRAVLHKGWKFEGPNNISREQDFICFKITFEFIYALYIYCVTFITKKKKQKKVNAATQTTLGMKLD